MKRLTSTRWPMSSVGSIEPEGIWYGLTMKAWISERQADRERDDHDELEEAPRAPSWASGSAGSTAGPCVLGLLTLGILCFVLGFPG